VRHSRHRPSARIPQDRDVNTHASMAGVLLPVLLASSCRGPRRAVVASLNLGILRVGDASGLRCFWLQYQATRLSLSGPGAPGMDGAS